MLLTFVNVTNRDNKRRLISMAHRDYWLKKKNLHNQTHEHKILKYLYLYLYVFTLDVITRCDTRHIESNYNTEACD